MAVLGRWPDAQAANVSVSLAIDDCLGSARTEIARLVAVELGSPLVGGAQATTRVKVECMELPWQVRLLVDDAVTGKSLARLIDLGRTAPETRSRLMALAIAELLSSSWAELTLPPTPELTPLWKAAAPKTEPVVVPVMVKVHEPRPRTPLVLTAVGTFDGFPSTGVFAGGGGLKLTTAPVPHLACTLGAYVEHGSRPVASGIVDTDLYFARLELGYRYAWRRAVLRASGALVVGAARLGGRSDDVEIRAGSVLGPLVVPAVSVAFETHLGRYAVVEIEAHAGYVTTPVIGTVAGQPSVGTSGSWLGLGVAIGASPRPLL